ncbi:RusA family crossover junction endodeoxyribonuclease [Kovacikia minuta CCNUW1]|uniref:RusA family crossover junction endodeoxyribonuclease n=1 Tax=Kovacikia minuta TaxID=2931930 RepID=UPI001CCE4E77|nr:RusA family crossover junction endodeoxyribonuclease [Kovacikia minuta]UBF26076.1 RusA family crossover junction endodeoxyribonuclease [Kovacikia minuta CCNUW1]
MNVPILLEFVLPRRPLSYQAKNSKHKQEWRDFIYGRAFSQWTGNPITKGGLKFSVVYLCEDDPGDINNIIKPIQDALITLVYSDDSVIWDVTGHMRLLSEPIDIIGLPPLLAEAVIGGTECIYVRITNSSELNSELK